MTKLKRKSAEIIKSILILHNLYYQTQYIFSNYSHLLRNLTFVAENEPAHKVWTDALAMLLSRIKEAVPQTKLSSETALTLAQQTDFTSRYDNILTCAVQAVRGSPKRQDLHLFGHRLYRRFLVNKEAILSFMTDFRVPFDNNGSERDLRMLKLQQKISGCFHSIEGVKVFCRSRSFLSSARKQGRGLLAAIELALKDKHVTLAV